MTNQFLGLARGPIDHQSSSVINVISDEAIDMGSAISLDPTVATGELLPRINQEGAQGTLSYGIVVGGDADGIYGDGSTVTSDENRAAITSGQAVVVVTQGRCLAKVAGTDSNGNQTIPVGTKLTLSGDEGLLQGAIAGDEVIAIALQLVASTAIDMIAVDVQRMGVF